MQKKTSHGKINEQIWINRTHTIWTYGFSFRNIYSKCFTNESSLWVFLSNDFKTGSSVTDHSLYLPHFKFSPLHINQGAREKGKGYTHSLCLAWSFLSFSILWNKSALWCSLSSISDITSRCSALFSFSKDVFSFKSNNKRKEISWQSFNWQIQTTQY